MTKKDEDEDEGEDEARQEMKNLTFPTTLPPSFSFFLCEISKTFFCLTAVLSGPFESSWNLSFQPQG